MLSKPARLSLLRKELPSLSVEDLKKRKVLQKTIYILQEMGFKFRYNYNWYIHGPYSSALADDAYELQNNKEYYEQEAENYHFRGNTKLIIDKFKESFKGKTDDEEWLELVASLLFLRKHYQLEGEKLKDLLLEKKKKFEASPGKVDEAILLITNNF